MAPPNPSEDMEKLDHSCITGGNVKWKQFGILGNGLAVSLKTKLATTIHPAIILLGIYPRETKTYTKKKYTNVYSSFINNNPNLETTRCPNCANCG